MEGVFLVAVIAVTDAGGEGLTAKQADALQDLAFDWLLANAEQRSPDLTHARLKVRPCLRHMLQRSLHCCWHRSCQSCSVGWMVPCDRWSLVAHVCWGFFQGSGCSWLWIVSCGSWRMRLSQTSPHGCAQTRLQHGRRCFNYATA